MATILIVEDNADLRNLVKIQLEKHGFSCLEATDGTQVLETLGASAVDLILMDMNMPELDGWEATIAVRACNEYANTPIIAITAYSLDGDRARAYAAGCNEFVCKPLEFDQLLTLIKKSLEPQVQMEPICIESVDHNAMRSP